MRRPVLLIVLLAPSVTLFARGAGPPLKDGPARTGKPGPTPVIHLAAQASKAPGSPLANRLLPDALDLVDGNAAPLWVRAGRAAREVRHKWTAQQWQWTHTNGMPLKKLPRKEVAALLRKHSTALQLADLAALRKRCDWGHLPLTVENVPLMDLGEIQSLREIANLINLRCRLALAEGKFAEARRSLGTGLRLARHVGHGQTVIHDLVGIAIASIMLGRVEEWIQLPGSPNLYWPLTVLPRPFIDSRRSIRRELGTIYRSVPQVRRIKEKILSDEEARALVRDTFATLCQVGNDEVPGWLKKVAPTVLALRYYPGAKKALIAAGRSVKEVEAMPSLQVVMLALLADYDQLREQVENWLAVPSWQGYDALQKVYDSHRKKAKKDGNVVTGLTALLVPALSKVYQAQMRLDRQIAGLRGAEALRQYAASHDGKEPAKWADLKDLPGPIDPFTGKGLDAYYKVEGGKAVLDIPPPPGMPALLGRRYELLVKAQ